MEVIVNGERREVPDRITVAELLRFLKVRTSAVAVERNRELVPRGQHDQT
ncbi:MAG: sulfur carrier protein ThiS, partial [Planctomycetota bacterium]